MNQPFTQTRTGTSTMTEARVRKVMVEIAADFAALAAAGLATAAQVADWRNDLLYILENETSKGFQVQLRCPGQSTLAIEYEVSADGSLVSNQPAGGIDFFRLNAGTKASLFVNLDEAAPKNAIVRAGLATRGWGTNGTAVTGTAVTDRTYSSEGYGVKRSLVGEF